METSFDLAVVGAGPGGYVAAIRAAQLGLKVACIELEPKLGGTCLRVGCIPSKALLEASHLYREVQHGIGQFGVKVSGVELDLPAMLKKKTDVVDSLTGGVAYLFKKNGVTPFYGVGSFIAPGQLKVTRQGEPDVELQAQHIIIATGSSVAQLKGVEMDGDRIGGSTEALSYPEVPKSLVVIGAGYIGLELGSVWSRLGSEVTVVEYFDRILPGMDKEIAQLGQRIFEKQGLKFKLGSRVQGVKREGDTCVVSIEGQEPIRCDRVLVSVGRVPNTEGLGLDRIGVELGPRGTVVVDDHFRTNVPGVYAIGDVIRGPMLAHKAEEEGVACVETIVKGHGHVDYNSIPGVVYTDPEIASVGKTEEQLKEEGVAYTKGVVPYSANGRAKALGSTEGRVKILAHAETDRVLGVHILGPRAGDLIAEAAVAMAFGASSEDIAYASHAHPTLAEVIKEAALATANGAAIHI